VLEVKDITVVCAPQGSSPEDQMVSIIFNERYDLLVNLPASQKIILTHIGYAYTALANHRYVEAAVRKVDKHTCVIQYVQITPKKD
jgi:hypothetical protein